MKCIHDLFWIPIFPFPAYCILILETRVSRPANFGSGEVEYLSDRQGVNRSRRAYRVSQ